jgi:hypothetical protein
MGNHLRRKHTYIGQTESSDLIAILNGELVGHPKRPKLQKELGDVIKKMNSSAERFLLKKLVAHIDRLLSHYKLWVETKCVTRSSSRLKTFSEPIWWFGWHSNSGNQAAIAIMSIIRLGGGGLLNRVRICERCSRWFYAHYNHQRFCGGKCRVKDYQTSEIFKKNRRARRRLL